MRKTLLALVFATALLTSAARVQAASYNPTGPGPGGGGNSQATINVVTNVINDDGGIALPANFLMTYGDGMTTLSTWAGFGAPGITMAVSPGNYAVQGSHQPYYARFYGPGCSGTLAENGSATCVVTYDDVAIATPECSQGCDGPTTPPPGGCNMTSCEPPAPPSCPVGSPDCAPITPPDVATCDPLSPGCNPLTPPDGGTTPPGGDTNTVDELPRTGGASLPMALVVMTFGVVLSLRKRS
ncbi:MAG: hypothetical protein WC866_02585 [Patescibacteria group bacterium]|jgi:hypothetical protein